MDEGVPGATWTIKYVLLSARNYGDISDKKLKNRKIFINKPKIGHFGCPEMGEGVPGATWVIKYFLLSAQNYGDISDKKLKNRKFLLIQLLGPNRAFWVPGNG